MGGDFALFRYLHFHLAQTLQREYLSDLYVCADHVLGTISVLNFQKYGRGHYGAKDDVSRRHIFAAFHVV